MLMPQYAIVSLDFCLTIVIVGPNWGLLPDRMSYDGAFSCLLTDVEEREKHV